MRYVLLLLILFSKSLLHAQLYPGQVAANKIPLPGSHYMEEYNFDTVVNTNAWKNLKQGLNVAFGTTDELFFRSEVPHVSFLSTEFESATWKNERINIQLLIWSPDTLRQVRIKASDLSATQGKLIPANTMHVKLVRYVLGNYPYGAKDVTCGESPYKDLYLMPDRFEDFDRFDLPGNSLRPVWITVDVPANTVAGIYKGHLEVVTDKESKKLPLTINVQNQQLPAPSKWKHRLDLWQNPWVVAWQNNLQPWSAEHKILLKKHLQLYADAGGKYITTYAVHSPWADNSYMIEGGMVEWVKTKSGKWKFNYKIFDEYVSLAMSVGINEAITIYTPVPWGNRFRYTDEATGNHVEIILEPGTMEFSEVWNQFLTDLKFHLKAKGWFNKTYLGINENAMPQTLAAIRVIKDHSKDWRITYAGDWHPELDTLLDDYSFLFGKESGVDEVKARTKRGQTTTYYVCCNPPVPNNFVFSPPIEGRWISWYSVAHSYDGFLRWAYDAWPMDPLRDARHQLWPAGDCFLIYPGATSSIRFEKLREGITDFEKIRILREKASRSGNEKSKKLIRDLDEHLQKFLNEKDFDKEKLKNDVKTGLEIIFELGAIL